MWWDWISARCPDALSSYGPNDGAEMGAAVHEYPHGVMDRTLSAADGRKLPPDFALQDPVDYLETLETIVRAGREGRRG